MKLSLCFATTTTILAVLVNFSLAAETAKPYQTGNSTHLEKGVQKSSSYYCNPYTDCSSFLGTYSSCNSDGRCVCDMGYEVRLGSTHCQRVSCSSMTDCTGKFGFFSHCSLGSCYCKAGYSYDLQLEICTGTIPIISAHYSCNSYSDCDLHLGIHSSCNSNGRCVCDMGYEERATSSSGLKCQRRFCSSMSDCTTKYGFNSHCSFGRCSCDTGYSYDLKSEKCTQTSPTTTIPTIASHYSCNSYSDCDRHLGIHSSCNSNGRCVCDMGYEERATTGSLGTGSNKCQRRSCSSMSDCTTKYGTNSHCNNEGSCSCDTGYAYDLLSEQCSYGSYITGGYDYYYYNSGPNFGLIIGLPVTIIGLIIIIGAIVMVRRRRQQELAAAAAARVVAMQRGAVVQQQPTVIISHQQNPQHSQHPVYYQPQQNPPSFNPTFTGYQPQQAPPQYQPPQYQPPAPASGVYPNVSSSGGQYPNPAQTHYKS